MDVLTIPSKTTPANATPCFIHDLCLAPLHRQEEVAVIGVDTVLHFRPQKDLDGLIVYIDGLTVFGHCYSRRREEAGGASSIYIDAPDRLRYCHAESVTTSVSYGSFMMRPWIVGYTEGLIAV